MPPYRGLKECPACHSHPGLYATAGDWIPAQGRNDGLRTASRSINGVVKTKWYYIRGVESWSLFGLGRLVGRPPGAPSSPHLPPASPRPPAQPPIQAARRAADRRRTSPRLRRGSPPAARPQPRGPRPWCTFSMDGLPASQRPVAETLLSWVVVSSRPSS